MDVGAGDGLLAEGLVRKGCQVVASEVRSGPWRVVAARLAGHGVEVRLGDGLGVVEPGEVAVAVIAGMGGRTILRILEKAAEVVRGLELLVIQPMQHLDEVRSALSAHPYRIVEELSVRQAGRLYTILLVSPDASR